MWTIDMVKDSLPPVRIRIGTQHYTGTIAGRCLPFATVYVEEIGYPFSWHAITRALNTDTPLYVPAAQPKGHTASARTRPKGDRYV
jgi:hypothetical protein